MLLDEVKRDVARRKLGFDPKNEDIMTCIDTLVTKTYIDRDAEGECAQVRYV